MKFCEHCGKEIKDDSAFCQNCGAAISKDENKQPITGQVVNNTTTPTVKDNTVLAFVLSIIGALCCTYVAIPGLILSIQSLQQMKDGKISNKNKWMAIVGIVLSAIGIVQMIWNFTHMDEANQRVQDIINRVNESTNK